MCSQLVKLPDLQIAIFFLLRLRPLSRLRPSICRQAGQAALTDRHAEVRGPRCHHAEAGRHEGVAEGIAAASGHIPWAIGRSLAGTNI